MAFAELVTRFAAPARAWIATHALDAAMVDEVALAAWRSARTRLAGGAAPSLPWLLDLAGRELAARLATVGNDALGHLLAQSCADALRADAPPSTAVAQHVQARFERLPLMARRLLLRRYVEHLGLAALAGAQLVPLEDAADSLVMARSALDWGPAAVGGSLAHGAFSLMVEEHLSGRMAGDQRRRLVVHLETAAQDRATFLRQVRIDLLLQVLLHPLDEAGLQALTQAAAADPVVADAAAERLEAVRIVAPATAPAPPARARDAGVADARRPARPRPGARRRGVVAACCGAGLVVAGVVALVALRAPVEQVAEPRGQPQARGVPTAPVAERSPEAAPAVPDPVPPPPPAAPTTEATIATTRAPVVAEGPARGSGTGPVGLPAPGGVGTAADGGTGAPAPLPGRAEGDAVGSAAVVEAAAPAPVPAAAPSPAASPGPAAPPPPSAAASAASADAAAPAKPAPRFALGIDFAGESVVIDGDTWLSQRQAETIEVAAGVEADCYLSDVPLPNAHTGLREVIRDADLEGHQLAIGATTYRKGLFAHAPSEIVVPLDGLTSAFSAEVGLDSGGVAANGSVVFQVFLDNAKVADSGLMRGNDAPRHLEVALGGAKSLRLVATDGGDGQNWDHAVWANARLISMRPVPPTAHTSLRNARRSVKAAATKPAAEGPLKAMLTSSVQGRGELLSFGLRVPNGTYDAWFWVCEDASAPRAFDLRVQGVTLAGLGGLAQGAWSKHGPVRVIVTTGTLSILARATKGVPTLSGMALFAIDP